MASSINIDQLAKAITDSVDEYTEDVQVGIKRVVNRTSNKVAKEIKTNYPYNDRTGEYTKGWRNSKVDRNGIIKRTIWNRLHYRRVHLLEFGHLTKDGKRVQAYPHVEPAYNKYAKNIDKEIKKVIESGGGK